MRSPKVTPAHATVDKIAMSIGGGEAYWKVTVWKARPPWLTRIYTVLAFTDTLAAYEGLRLFNEELDNPIPGFATVH